MRTPSARPELPRRLARLAGACAALALGAAAHAHEDAHWPPGGATGFTPILGAGWNLLAADRAAPVARLPGVLEGGSARGDERGGNLDYIEAGFHWAINDTLSSELRLARHGEGDGKIDVEAAWLQLRTSLANGELQARGGRMQVPLGQLNRQHRHDWTFGIAPLVYRAALNESWLDDGLTLDWRNADGWYGGAGLFRGKPFPGANVTGAGAATLNGGFTRGPWNFELGLGYSDAPGRALDTSGVSDAGHTHAQPRCDRLANDRVCFDGEATLVALSGRWVQPGGAWRAEAELWGKREHGSLASLNGNADYTGTVTGGWLQLGWQASDKWDVALRLERLQAEHQVNGVGASLLARQAGILDSEHEPARIGLALGWRPLRGQRIALEVHRDESLREGANVLLLRVQLDLASALGR